MATYTTNLNLKKPAQSDKIRIADINNNMDDIDAAFGAIGNDSVATQMGNIQDALAIVAVGDSHAAITAGQYVYVKSHETLDTGLYVASANIAQNGALSSSNLTADTAGGLNALNSKITDLFVTEEYSMPATSWSAGTIGTFIGTKSVSITKTGYTPISATISRMYNTWYMPILHIGSTTVEFELYRATNTAESIGEGNCKAKVLYMKNS